MRPPWLSPEDAYQNDTRFRAVVDQLEYMIHAAELTPAEVRAASMLACIHYETKVMRSFEVVVGVSGQQQLRAIEERVEQMRRWLDLASDGHPYRNSKG